jgi:sugar-specific transcriptional regulator TrmB
MASGPEDVEILNSLGLTINAAKVFLALSELGTATAKTISKTSGVAREVVYQLMPSLVKKGLVEEVLTSPKSFKAIPLKAAYNQLLQHKKEENRKISRKIDEALKKKKASTLHVEDKNQISIIIDSGGQQQHFKIHNEFKKVQKSLDMTFSLGKILQWSQHYAELDIKELERKNVRVRIITEERLLKLLAESPEIFSSIISKLKHVSFRYIQNSPAVEMMIFDKKKLFLSTRKDANINKMRWLYSNNPALLEITNSYYETLWESAAETGENCLNPIMPMWNPKT